MNSYSPVWDSIVDSSLWDEPYYVRVLFVSMLAVKGPDYVCRGDSYKFAKRFNIKEEEVLDALKILSEPDKRRLGPQPFEGRRIEAVDGGFLILNAEKYRVLMTTEGRRMKQAAYQRAYRLRIKLANGSPLVSRKTATNIKKEARMEAAADAIADGLESARNGGGAC